MNYEPHGLRCQCSTLLSEDGIRRRLRAIFGIYGWGTVVTEIGLESKSGILVTQKCPLCHKSYSHVIFVKPARFAIESRRKRRKTMHDLSRTTQVVVCPEHDPIDFMKIQYISKALLAAATLLALPDGAHAIKITVPDQYKDQVEATKAAERKEREQELEGVAEDAESGIQIAGEDKPVAEKPKVDADEFLVQSVIAATDAATEFEGTLAADEGIVSGQVIDKESGEPVSGVAILIEGTDVATVTDATGRYSLGPAPAGTYTLTFVKTGYIEANVTEYALAGGEVSVFPFAMPPRPAEMSDEVYELQDFTVTAEEANSMMAVLMDLRQDSFSSINALSASDFSRFAASDAAEALTKISGVSISDGKYAVVRGLNERYNTTLLNGISLPSPDPDTKAVPLDIFSTGLFESIVTRKTFTADQPGESSGGSIDLRTKSFPDEFFFKFSLKSGRQDGASDILVDPESKIEDDFVRGDVIRGFSSDGSQGYDNKGIVLVKDGVNVGSKDVPADSGIVESWPNYYAQRKSVGPDFGMSASIGNSFNLNDSGSVRLGILWGGNYEKKFRKTERYLIREEFNNGLQLNSVLFEEKGKEEALATSLISLGLSIGEDYEFTYDNIYIRQAESEASIGLVGEDLSIPGNFEGGELSYKLRTMNVHQLGGNITPFKVLGIRPEFDWAMMLANNRQSEPDTRAYGGYQEGIGFSELEKQPVRFDRETKQETKSGRFEIGLPFSEKFKVNLGFSTEDVQREFNQLEWPRDRNESNQNPLGQPGFAAASQNFLRWPGVFDGDDFDMTDADVASTALKLPIIPDSVDTVQEMADFLKGFNPSVWNDETLFFNENGTLSYLDSSIATPFDTEDIIQIKANGNMEIHSYYASVEAKPFDWMRMNVGARYEDASISYDDDPEFPGKISGVNFPLFDIAGGEVAQADVLPTATFIIEPFDDFSIRASWSETVARPSFRELAPFPTYNLTDGIVEIGNPGRILVGTNSNNAIPIFDSSRYGGVDYDGLSFSDVENFDLRFEWTPGEALFSATYFQKTIGMPIEKVAIRPPTAVGDTFLYTYINNENEAQVRGVELEALVNLGWAFDREDTFLGYINVGGNYTFIDAEVERSALEDAGWSGPFRTAYEQLGDTRPLFDQPEFLANAYITFDLEPIGAKFTVSGNITGRQLDVVGTSDTHPDLYLEELFTLNLVWEQKINDTWSIKFSAKNINKPNRDVVRDEQLLLALEDVGQNVEVGALRERVVIRPSYSISVTASF